MTVETIKHEEWRAIPGWEGLYSVSDRGRVRREDSGRISEGSNSRGYRQFALCAGGKRQNQQVHTLVALAFLGPRPPGHDINHKNCDKADNRLENLEYVTHRRNVAHAVENGRVARGETNGHAKLTEEEVYAIRQAYAEGDVTFRELAERFGVDKETPRDIVTHRSWRHAPGPKRVDNRARGERVGSAKLTEADVLELRARFASGGETYSGLAREYGVTFPTIKKTITGELWSHVEGQS